MNARFLLSAFLCAQASAAVVETGGAAAPVAPVSGAVGAFMGAGAAISPISAVPGASILAPSLNTGAVIKAFSKDNDKLVTTAVSLGGQLLAASALDKVASLPTREQALAQLLGVMKAPIQKLAATLAAAPTKLVRTLAAVRDQKQAAAA